MSRRRDGDAEDRAGRVGPKRPVSAPHAVCASQHPIVTETMLETMRAGGNAVDAAIAGSLVQAGIQQELTNHAGTVTFLYYEAATGKTYELNSMGTIAPDVAPFRPIPPERSLFPGAPMPAAVIPGFMPGLKAMYDRFGTRPWAELCEPAIRWADEGHIVGSLEHAALAKTVDTYLYTPSGRAHFMPNGYLPEVGDRWPKPELAKTMRGLAHGGPDYFISGEWGRAFVERANSLGWSIELRHMDAVPVRWGEGLRYRHGEHELVQLSPPERVGVFCALVLGILEGLDLPSLGHYTESAEALYYIGHALRRAQQETGFLNDPEVWEDPTETLMSPDYHAFIADILRRSRPKVDLTRHLELAAGRPALAAAGAPQPPTMGSCELSLVDADGNWVQMMNTLQSGGIPGEVVGGVSMYGSHVQTRLDWVIAGWFTGGGRMRSLIGNTFVLRDGKPVWSLGTPGYPAWYVSQVLVNGLIYGLDPHAAEDAPRMLPLGDDYRLSIESRLAPKTVAGLARLGILVDPLGSYDWTFGSFGMSWRDTDGTLHASAGPRGAGTAAGY
jgi:gamma-glutamyltranspeptidase/glutathione hydrolase